MLRCDLRANTNRLQFRHADRVAVISCDLRANTNRLQFQEPLFRQTWCCDLRANTNRLQSITNVGIEGIVVICGRIQTDYNI